MLLGFFKIFQQKNKQQKKLHEKVCTTWVTQNAMLSYKKVRSGQVRSAALGRSQ